ncbi:MAG: bifunctional enoyl-CoA hydratase/phosphate acetyltransferase [Wenzhouxiangella sp.]|nr:MAG: bifunctional enoyl-CoA hydratase/phosphate acetyltransferase [Wenzhouxiangella sp.]
MKADEYLENHTFDELKIGQQAGLSRTLSKEDIDLFAVMSGDVNPAHLDEVYANNTIFQGIIGHGMWPGALISTVLGTVLPGPGTIYLSQELRFSRPVRIGDTVHVSVTVREKRSDKPMVTMDCECRNDLGELLVSGKAVVLAPTEKVRKKRAELPEVHFRYHDRYRDLIDSCAKLDPLTTAIVHPVKAHGIKAIAQAMEENLLAPVLVGPRDRILAAAEEAEVDISDCEIVDVEHSHAAAQEAVRLAASGRVQALMKGALHTDELLSALVSSSGGLRTERRISHAYVMDVPNYHKPLIITDAAINIAPSLDIKADICRNAIALWRIMAGNEDSSPKVAVLSAVETVNARMQSTLDASALCKMADRGQIENALIDGPLGLDAAISRQSAENKGIKSEVAGDADILIAPDIEAGNMIAKQLTFLGNSDAAGLVLGARVPVILTSRSDNLRTRLMSVALAVHMAEARKSGNLP